MRTVVTKIVRDILSNISVYKDTFLFRSVMPERDLRCRRLICMCVLSKLFYASPAWWGNTSAADKQRLEATVRRAILLGLYTAYS